ncbi:CVNH domain-containing protein [Aetokthonos hydrillicola]
MVLKRVGIIVFMIVLSFLQQNITLAADLSTCRDVRINEGSVLEAQCPDNNNRLGTTSIQLNNYIANIDGRLIWRRNGNFRATSRSCEIGHNFPEMSCLSRRNNSKYVSSTIIVDERIFNINGILQYKTPPADQGTWQ